MDTPHAQRDVRDNKFDISKGILIILVILGHSLLFVSYAELERAWVDPVVKLIYMFHMPLFMVFSGYFFSERSLSFLGLMSRVKSLLYPMATWAVIIASLHAIVSKDFLGLPLEIWNTFVSGYWFLWAVIMANFILWSGLKIGNSAGVLYCCIMIFLLAVPEFWDVLPKFSLVLPFFVAGYYMRRNGISLTKRHHPSIVFFSLILSLACYVNWDLMTYVYLNRASFLNFPSEVILMFTGVTAATISVTAPLLSISSFLEKTVFGDVLSRIGRLTMEIYLVQGLVFSASYQLREIVPGSGSQNELTRWFVAVVFSSILTFVILVFVEKTKRARLISKVLWAH